MSPEMTTLFVVLGGIAAIVTILGGIYQVWKVGVGGLWERIKLRLARMYWRVPKQTLIILPDIAKNLRWDPGTSGGRPAMHVVGDFYFTNISDRETLIPKTYLTAYFLKWKVLPCWREIEGFVFLRHPDRDTYGRYPVLPGRTTTARATWSISPPIKRLGETMLGRVTFIDQYGNKHRPPLITWINPPRREDPLNKKDTTHLRS